MSKSGRDKAVANDVSLAERVMTGHLRGKEANGRPREHGMLHYDREYLPIMWYYLSSILLALFDKYNPCILAVLLTSRAHLESFMHEYLMEPLMMGEMLCSAEQIALKLAVVSQSVQVSNYYHIWHAMGFP